ncbi:MAG: ABC transporter ATP-binding protein [Verrucomicrobiota bacterium]
MIEIENLTICYGDLKAVDDLNLRVEKGELFAFLGPNGAGKTSTIKSLVGLIRPTSGAARICGYDLQTDPVEAKARLGYVPDIAVFYEKLTPREFMGFIADIFGVDEKAGARATNELFETFQLHEYENERIESLSHGTRQRVAIASGLLHEPEVFVIDEPMVGLDPILARVVKDELRRRAVSGMTIFMSTHLLNIAEELAARIGIINRGKLVALGTMEELRHQAEDGNSALESIFLELFREEPEAAPSLA